MLAKSKIKWFGSIVLAGILLFLALMGGSWGTTPSASASVDTAPYIISLSPQVVRVGSADTLVRIYGNYFGDLTNTQVRLTARGVDVMLTPLTVNLYEITLTIPAYLLINPTWYTLTVIKTTPGTVPLVETSNPVTFWVFSPYIYCPLIIKM